MTAGMLHDCNPNQTQQRQAYGCLQAHRVQTLSLHWLPTLHLNSFARQIPKQQTCPEALSTRSTQQHTSPAEKSKTSVWLSQHSRLQSCQCLMRAWCKLASACGGLAACMACSGSSQQRLLQLLCLTLRRLHPRASKPRDFLPDALVLTYTTAAKYSMSGNFTLQQGLQGLRQNCRSSASAVYTH